MNVISRVTLIKQEKVRVSLVCTSKYVACKKYIYVYFFPQESPGTAYGNSAAGSTCQGDGEQTGGAQTAYEPGERGEGVSKIGKGGTAC